MPGVHEGVVFSAPVDLRRRLEVRVAAGRARLLLFDVAELVYETPVPVPRRVPDELDRAYWLELAHGFLSSGGVGAR